jgi:hypothetical protein
MVSTDDLTHRSAPGSIPGRSSRDMRYSRCEAVVDVVSSATCQVVETIETREAPQ